MSNEDDKSVSNAEMTEGPSDAEMYNSVANDTNLLEKESRGVSSKVMDRSETLQEGIDLSGAITRLLEAKLIEGTNDVSLIPSANVYDILRDDDLRTEYDKLGPDPDIGIDELVNKFVRRLQW